VIFSRLLAVLVASFALAGCAGVVLVSVIFAFWALLAPALGGVGATAAVIFALALTVAIAAVGAVLVLRPPASAAAASAPTVEAAIGFARDRPVFAVVAAVFAIVLTAIQPRLAAAVARNIFRRARQARA
jgi:hypothetical protein